MRKQHFEKKYLPYLMLLPSFFIVLIVVIYPTVHSMFLAFHKWDLMRPSEPMRFVGLYNFQKLLSDYAFWTSLQVTVTYVVSAVTIEFFLGLGLALLLVSDRRTAWISIMRTILLIPLLISPIVSGFLWRFLYLPRAGLFNYLLSWFGIQGEAWLANPSTALPAVIFAEVWLGTPFVVLVFISALLSLPTEPLEAAKVDGASEWQTFRFVTLPMLRAVSAVVILLKMMITFKVFDMIFVATQGAPGLHTEVLTIHIWRIGFKRFDMGYASAMSYALFILVYAISLIFIRLVYKEALK